MTNERYEYIALIFKKGLVLCLIDLFMIGLAIKVILSI